MILYNWVHSLDNKVFDIIIFLLSILRTILNDSIIFSCGVSERVEGSHSVHFRMTLPLNRDSLLPRVKIIYGLLLARL